MTLQASLIRASSYDGDRLRSSLDKLLEPWGDISAFVRPGDRVLLKPNLLASGVPSREFTTNPQLVGTIAQMVRQAGGKPFLGDSPSMGTAAGVARANGLLAVARELDLPIVEFSTQTYKTNNPEFPKLQLAKEALEADAIVNLPKIKSHQQLTITLGVKNLFGCVPGKTKMRWHWQIGKQDDRFARMLVETARSLAPQLTIVDGIVGHQGNGPHLGEPRFLGLLAASDNVFAIDRVLADVLRVDLRRVPTIAAATDMGVSPAPEAIAFPNLSVSDVAVDDWKLADRDIPIYFSLSRVLLSALKDKYIRWIREPAQS